MILSLKLKFNVYGPHFTGEGTGSEGSCDFLEVTCSKMQTGTQAWGSAQSPRRTMPAWSGQSQGLSSLCVCGAGVRGENWFKGKKGEQICSIKVYEFCFAN